MPLIAYAKMLHAAQTKSQPLPKISTVDALLYLLNNLTKNLNTQPPVDTILVAFDLEKAFDKVSFQIILSRLALLGLSSNVLKWFTSYLTNRFQQVRVGAALSTPTPVLSGVVQGSVLGALLFLIFINELPTVVQLPADSILFADDCTLYCPMASSDTPAVCQENIEKICNWCTSNLMSLNANKCAWMFVSNIPSRANNLQFTLSESTTITHQPSVILLGLKVSSNLRWREHIEDVVLNCRKRLGAMYRQFKDAPSSIRLQIYKTCILAKLDYACALYDNNFANLESQLESVQKLAAHMITRDFHTPGKVLVEKLKLPLLSVRR
ncbi:unnamed protein product, partial [Didymodactylos carnosus]